MSRWSPISASTSSPAPTRVSEQSDSTVGLTHRWVIKGIFAAGLWLVVLGILSVLLRVIVFLFGGMSNEEVNLQIGHVEADI